jgi:hypothetical protein
VGTQDALAEAVEGGDPCALGLAGALALAQLEQPPTHAGAQLAGGLVGERDRQHLVGTQPVVHDRGDEALDEHGRLPRAGVGRQHEVAVAPRDGLGLLGGEGARHDVSQRQIVGWAQPPP